MKKNLSPQLSVRLYTDEKCFGPGIAQLLERVRELSSLRSAAMSMSMAYSKAWSIIKNCEAALGFKLLTTTTGGKHGGGAVLTSDAQRLLEAYTAFCRELDNCADKLFCDKFKFLIEETPKNRELEEK